MANMDQTKLDAVSLGPLFAHHSAHAEIAAGSVSFASPAEQSARAEALGEAGFVVVTAAPPAIYVRAALAEHLDDLIERELASRGAPSPHLTAWSTMPDDAEARLADQLFRARSVGAKGLALVIGSLRGLAIPSLTPEDSAALGFLAAATHDAPLHVVLDDDDARREAYVPLRLEALVRVGGPAQFEELPANTTRTTDEGIHDEGGLSCVESTPEAEHEGDAPAPTDTTAETTTAETTTAEMETVAAGASDVESALVKPPAPPASVEERGSATRDALRSVLADIDLDDLVTGPSTFVQRDADLFPHADDLVEHELDQHDENDAEQDLAAHDDARRAVDAEQTVDVPDHEAARADLAEARRAEAAQARAVQRATVGVPVSGRDDAWRSWALALGAAKGPQPLAVFERLFAESYVPLSAAIARGLDEPRAVRAHDDFRAGFERSYTDAFMTFGATGRRPRLVMDAFDVAAKQARLHSARTTQLLVVDGLRLDVGLLVRDALARGDGRLSLTSETLLWSALPTTTFRQLETLARGMDALRAPVEEESADSLRGLRAESVRRMRVGSRELHKLDVVPSLLGSLEAGGPRAIIDALPSVAGSVADALLRHVASLPPRTLLLVIGDHGFTIDRRGRVAHGGATPEEVLVPAFSYLVGDLH